MSRCRTIFLCIPNGHHAANLLRTDVFTCLLEVPYLRIVILSPLVREARFVSEFQHDRVVLEELHSYDPPYVERAVYSVLQERFARRTGIESVRIEIKRKHLLGGNGRRRGGSSLRRLLAGLPFPASIWLRAVELAAPDRRYAPIFKQHHPDILVTATAGMQFVEMPLIRQARRQGIPVMGVDLSWDHLTLKSQTLQRVDHLVVWNEQMRREAIAFHGFSAKAVEVSGVPQFDGYFRCDGKVDRAHFLKNIGGDPSKKLITFTTVPQSRHPYQVPVIRAILVGLMDGRLDDAQLLIRIHPQDKIEPYAEFHGLLDVIVEKPFTPVESTDGYPVDPTREERAHLANTLAHSDVLVNFASSMTIEACIFGVPVVNFVCDDPAVPLALSPRRYYRFEHYRRIIDAGAVSLAENCDEVVSAIRAYLDNPSADCDGRQHVVRELCGFTDGRSGERVARAILGVVNRFVATRGPGLE